MSRMLKAGCQTFTWEMLGAGWSGGADALFEAIAAGGYAGVEISDKMIGQYNSRPAPLARALEKHALTLVAYACGSKSGFTEPDALSADLKAAETAISFAGAFPGAHVSFGSATITSEGPRIQKFDAAARFYNEAAALGRRSDVPVAMHPSSHHNTLLFDGADYAEMFQRLDPALVGWVPDTGHIIRGGQDVLDTLNAYRDRIRYIHLKDVDHDGTWQMLGTGACDTAAVIGAIRSAPHFNGWLVLEEESDEAGRDPAAAVIKNRKRLAAYGV